MAQAATIAGGSNHSCAIKDDATTWCWGANGLGQIGDGTTTASLVPVQVPGLSSVVGVAAGQDFSVALDDFGNVHTWGSNSMGQLGDDLTSSSRTSPYQVPGLSGITMVAAGPQFVLALRNDGAVFGFGKNTYGQLGDDTTTQRNAPVQVKDAAGTGYLSGVVGIAAGGDHALAVMANGGVYAWGGNSSGQIGIGNTTSPQKLPKQVLGVGGSGTLGGVSAVTAGTASSYALKSDGTLVSWGLGDRGQLGINSTTQQNVPVQVLGVGGSGTLADVGAIAGGDAHVLALKNDGTLYAFGKNANGQLGDNATTDRLTAVQVKDTAGTGYLTSVVAIGAGVNHSLAVRSGTPGTAWGWGLNSSGQLGDNSTTQRLTPVQVSGSGFSWSAKTPSFSPPGGTYTTNQNVAITSATPNATVRYTTGQNPLDPGLSDPVLGSGQTVAVTESTSIKAKAWAGTLAPSNVAQAGYTLKVVPVAIAPGTGTYTTAQSVTLSTTTLGAAIYYTTNAAEPTTGSTPYTGAFTISTGTTLKAKAFKNGWADSDTTTAVLSFNYGTLAAPTFSPVPGTYVGSRSVALTAGVAGATIRYTLDGSEPNATSTSYASPVLVDISQTLKAKAFHPDWTESPTATGAYTILQGDIAAGEYHSGVVDAFGRLWMWGHGAYGQLGDGSNSQRAVPTQIVSLTGVKAVAAGEYHTLVLKTDGTVWAFGHNSYGQLGDATTTSRNAPVQVKGVGGTGYLTGIVAVAAGAYHSLALQDTGLVFAFGLNSSSQLGDGTATNRTTPVQVSTLTSVVSIAAGQTHSLAAKGNGTAFGWGANGSGQLGTGNTTASSTPVQVSTLTSAVKVAAGDVFSLATTSSGTLYAWGTNSYSQLGDGTTTQRTSPVPVQVITGGSAVSAGTYHSLGLDSGGVAWGWAYNAYGQVGDGTTTNRSTPVPVVGPSNVARVRAGRVHSVALSNEGEIWVWGDNTYNQLGDGTTTGRPTPVKIAEAGFLWRVATPVLTPAPGTYTASQNVVLTNATPGASIHYTTNGNEPTQSDSSVTSGGSVSVAQTLTLKAKGFKTGMAPSVTTSGLYTLVVATPTLSPVTGTYSTPQTVTVSCSVAGATIRYTTNGVDPTESDPSIVSGGTLVVDASRTLKARAFKTGWTQSAVNTATYTMKVATPTLAPPGGGYGSVQAITISTATPGATLHYTTDGVDPLETDTQIASGSSLLLNWSLTLKVRGFRQGWTPSDIVSNTYLLTLGNVSAPTFSPPPGSYATGQTVSISSAVGAVIKYTTDGSDPSFASRTYSAAFAVDSTTTVKARAYRADWTPSAIASANYTITSGAVAAPTFSLAAGIYTTSQTLTMSTVTSGATLRYTTTGADPTESDAEAPAGGLLIDRAMIVKARAFKSGLPASGVTRADYIVTGGLAAGWYHSLLLKADGTVLTSGQNSYGQLGHGNTTNRTTFAAITALPDGRAVAAGNYHSLVLRSDGTVWAFGYNGYGQLGDASSTNRTSPVQVKGVGGTGYLTGIVAIAARGNNSYAVRGSDGVVFSWGINSYGQLGNGTTTTSNVPVQVSGLSAVVSVAAGDGHALALKSDGTVYAFGLNNYGQLGDGTNTQRTTPVAVSTLYGVRKLATLPLSSYAIKADGLISGRLWAWGHNFYGQIGDGTTTARNKPVSGMGEVIDVAGGNSSVHAADVHGKTWGWGYNELSSIGDGTGLQRSVPVLVRALKDLVALAGGYSSALALRADGALFGWGGNSGQLGDGTTTTRTTPTLISGVSVVSNAWLLTDTDGDGLTNIAEYRYGTDPLDPDSNDNGIQDGVEQSLGTDASSPDSDGDGLSNNAELAAGTDPMKADTDGDGVLDGADQWPLDPTRSSSTPNPTDQTPPTITLLEPSGAVPLP